MYLTYKYVFNIDIFDLRVFETKSIEYGWSQPLWQFHP